MDTVGKITFNPNWPPGEAYSNPKPKTPRDSKYKAWIKLQPCFNCGKTPAGDPHHYQPIGGGCGIGMKVSDLWCIPLCRTCHIGAQNDKFFFSEIKRVSQDYSCELPDDRWILVKIIKLHDEYYNWGREAS